MRQTTAVRPVRRSRPCSQLRQRVSRRRQKGVAFRHALTLQLLCARSVVVKGRILGGTSGETAAATVAELLTENAERESCGVI